MKRRDVLKSIFGAPFVPAIIPTAGGTDIVLVPGAVRIGLRVYDVGRGRAFDMTLLAKPWPSPGDRVRFDYKTLHLVGIVERTEAEPFHGGDNILFHVNGRVIEFRGKGPRG